MNYNQNLDKNSGAFHVAYSIMRNGDNTAILTGINPNLSKGDTIVTKEFSQMFELEVLEVEHSPSNSLEFRDDPRFKNAFFKATCFIKKILL